MQLETSGFTRPSCAITEVWAPKRFTDQYGPEAKQFKRKFVIVCTTHKVIITSSSEAHAKGHASNSHKWCNACRKLYLEELRTLALEPLERMQADDRVKGQVECHEIREERFQGLILSRGDETDKGLRDLERRRLRAIMMFETQLAVLKATPPYINLDEDQNLPPPEQRVRRKP